jgi:hypothetical protein
MEVVEFEARRLAGWGTATGYVQQLKQMSKHGEIGVLTLRIRHSGRREERTFD